MQISFKNPLAFLFQREVSQRQAYAREVQAVLARVRLLVFKQAEPVTKLEQEVEALLRQHPSNVAPAYAHLYAHLRAGCDRTGLYVQASAATRRCYPALDAVAAAFRDDAGKYHLHSVTDMESNVTYAHHKANATKQPARPQAKAVSKGLASIMERKSVVMGQTVEL